MRARNSRRSSRRSRELGHIGKPRGLLSSRVQAVGPEHFGIVAVDCAKARSKWMLTDFYGRILLPPTHVAHTRPDLDAAVAQVRQAFAEHQLQDGLVAIERTGRYHRVVQRAFAAAGFETRILPAYLNACRWFGGKTRSIRTLRIVERIPVGVLNGEQLFEFFVDEPVLHARLGASEEPRHEHPLESGR